MDPNPGFHFRDNQSKRYKVDGHIPIDQKLNGVHSRRGGNDVGLVVGTINYVDFETREGEGAGVGGVVGVGVGVVVEVEGSAVGLGGGTALPKSGLV